MTWIKFEFSFILVWAVYVSGKWRCIGLRVFKHQVCQGARNRLPAVAVRLGTCQSKVGLLCFMPITSGLLCCLPRIDWLFPGASREEIC